MVVDINISGDLVVFCKEYEHHQVFIQLLAIRVNLNAMLIIVFKVCIFLRFRSHFIGRYYVLSINKLRNIKCSMITKLGYFLSYWLVALNLMLLVICFPILVYKILDF